MEDAWKKAGVRPAREAGDEEYLRRVYLDVLGRIPTPEEVMTTPYLTVRDRAQGYWAGLETAGIAAADVPYADTDGERETVWAAMAQLFGGERQPTAILAMSDRAALFAIDWLQANGRRVPQDVSVVGFDGVPEGAETIPSLTSVQQPYEEIAARAVNSIRVLPRRAWWSLKSTSISPIRTRSVGGLAPPARRSTARTRASSSVIENGLVT